MKLLVTVIWMAMSFPASAQIVYKCVDWKGHGTYQSQPCPSQSRNEKAWIAVPDPVLTDEQISHRAATTRAQAARDAYNRKHHGPAPAPSAARIPAQYARDESACENAKANRKAVLDSVGLKRTYNLLQRLDDQVNRACR
jgi:hypothetical protein